MKKNILALAVIGLILTVSGGALAATDTGNVPDYSQKSSWYKIPAITKDVDMFFIYPTEYMGFNESDPNYATLDNPEMVAGVQSDHILQAGVYEDSTNVFVPYYRQASLRYAGEVMTSKPTRT